MKKHDVTLFPLNSKKFIFIMKSFLSELHLTSKSTTLKDGDSTTYQSINNRREKRSKSLPKPTTLEDDDSTTHQSISKRREKRSKSLHNSNVIYAHSGASNIVGTVIHIVTIVSMAMLVGTFFFLLLLFTNIGKCQRTLKLYFDKLVN